jgi:glycerol-3-phosphate acyltransferase PlsY
MRLGADIRERGSGGTGATNVSRSAGKVLGVLTLVLDALKGAAAVLLARLLGGGAEDQVAWIAGAAAVAALLGHIFPVWLKFRGGKGVATGLGAMALLTPFATIVAVVAFVVTFLLTRYVSLSSMIAAICLPITILVYGTLSTPSVPVAMILTTLAGAALIVWAHRANIARLKAGTESKFR